jgi:transcription initiation factor IIE alpha subunit
MEICSNGHEEIVFKEGLMLGGYNSCPLCEALKYEQEALDLEKKNDELTDKIYDLEERIKELEG